MTTSGTHNYRCSAAFCEVQCNCRSWQQRIVPLFLCTDVVLEDSTQLKTSSLQHLFLQSSVLLQSRLWSLDADRMRQRLNVNHCFHLSFHCAFSLIFASCDTRLCLYNNITKLHVRRVGLTCCLLIAKLYLIAFILSCLVTINLMNSFWEQGAYIYPPALYL